MSEVDQSADLDVENRGALRQGETLFMKLDRTGEVSEITMKPAPAC